MMLPWRKKKPGMKVITPSEQLPFCPLLKRPCLEKGCTFWKKHYKTIIVKGQEPRTEVKEKCAFLLVPELLTELLVKGRNHASTP